MVLAVCLAGAWMRAPRTGFYGWQAADLPEGRRARRFLPVSDDYLYVETQDGRYFAFGLAPDLAKAWQEVQAIQVGELRRLGRSDCARVEGPWSPAVGSSSPAIEGIECGYWTEEARFYKHSFAILENGEVWRWQMR